jgi:hypothetical protein
LKGGYGFLFRLKKCFRTTRELEYSLFLSRKETFFIIEKYCYNSVFFISNIVSEDKTKCLPYQEFQNKEEFEDIQRGN